MANPLWCTVDMLWVYIVYLLSTCLNQSTLFILYNAETLPQNCSWSCKEHYRLEGQASELLYWTTRQKESREKKDDKHSRIFLPFSRSGVSKQGYRFRPIAVCNSLPTAGTLNTSNQSVPNFIHNTSDSIFVREDQICWDLGRWFNLQLSAKSHH